MLIDLHVKLAYVSFLESVDVELSDEGAVVFMLKIFGAYSFTKLCLVFYNETS